MHFFETLYPYEYKISIKKIFHHWIFKFIKAIPQAQDNTFKTCEWALKAHSLYKQIAKEENISFDMVEKGILHIYTDKNEFENARKVNKIYNKAGLKRWEVSAKECLEKGTEMSSKVIQIIGARLI